MGISISVMLSAFESFWPWFYIYSVVAIVAFRSIFKEKIDLLVLCFIFTYFILNMIVNLVDFVIYQHALGFYEDQQFLKMFGYKLW
jgi:hypothetical protein